MSPPAAAPLSIHRFAFSGRTADYFRIWAVSLCLSLLTLESTRRGQGEKAPLPVRAHAARGLGVQYRAPLAILKGCVIALALRRLRAIRHFFP
jgi:hypothetical protein